MYRILFIVLAVVMSASGSNAASNSLTGDPNQNTVDNIAASMKQIPFETITGDTVTLADFSGKVVLIVNVASQCGNTPQYTELQKLYSMYKDSGLVVIGFPANNFGGQEPGSNEEILDFCQTNFNVTFPMMAKVSVKGNDKHPLFVQLTDKSSIPGEIKWNFSKFLLDRNGNLVARFDSPVKPLSDQLLGSIKKLL